MSASEMCLWELTLQWRHNEHDGVSNHQPGDCLLNRLFRRRSKKTSKLRVTGLCVGYSPVTGEFPTQRASHSVDSPSMVDPQWNIWYWGSKWNFHTVCWDAVGCELGTTSVYFWITYVFFIPSRLTVLINTQLITAHDTNISMAFIGLS